MLRLGSWRHSPRGERRGEAPAERAWQHSGVGDEVEAFLAGRLVDYMATRHQPVPAWAALNRLAHSDHDTLALLVEGAGLDTTGRSVAPHPWAAVERFAAAQIMIRAPTAERLAGLQRSTLVPLELDLVERARLDRLTAEQVLDAAVAALDTYHAGG